MVAVPPRRSADQSHAKLDHIEHEALSRIITGQHTRRPSAHASQRRIPGANDTITE